MKRKLSFKSSGFYFDGCYSCRKIAEAEDRGNALNYNGFEQIFREAKRSNKAKVNLVGAKII